LKNVAGLSADYREFENHLHHYIFNSFQHIEGTFKMVVHAVDAAQVDAMIARILAMRGPVSVCD
jgi:hypothetical protein